MKSIAIFLTFLTLLIVDSFALAAGPTSQPVALAITRDPAGENLQQSLIYLPANAKPSSAYVAFRKTFTLPAAPASANLRIFADARYMLWINGTYILRGPARFDTHGPEYDWIDVAKYLNAGQNVAAVLVLGNISNGQIMRHAPGLTLNVEVPGDAGPSVALKTDESWKWTDRTRYRTPKVTWADVQDRIDARLETDGDWTQLAYDDAKWQPAARIDGSQWGPLTARRIPLLRETPLVPKFNDGENLPITLAAGEKLKIDMGRLVQAYTVLDIDAAADTELSLDYANIQYLARAGRQTHITSDTHGFAQGTITVKSGSVTLHGLKLVERLYPFDVVGSFHSSDPTLDRLWNVCARSTQLFSEDAYIDCADRERVEWMDCDPPLFDVTRTALAGPGSAQTPALADARLLEEMLRRTGLSLQPEGWVKAHTCSDRFDIHAKMEDRACDWVEGARRYYESTGKTEVIREIWPAIVTQMNYFLAQRSSRGLVNGREWTVWGNPLGYFTCEGATLNAFVYKALIDAAYLGRLIGETAQASAFEKSAAELAAAFNTLLWDESAGTYLSGYFPDYAKYAADPKAEKLSLAVKDDLVAATMFPALFALDQGIVPANRRERVLQYLLANRSQTQRIMTYYYLFNQLYKVDQAALDREVLDAIRTKWKGMAESAWQTTWEEFKGGSTAHCYGVFPGYFLSAYVLGVRLDGPAADRRLIIDPRLANLTSASGDVVTELGVVPVSWRVNADGKLAFDLTIPANATAELSLADAEPGTLMLNGETVQTATKGRRVMTKLKAGKYSGTVSLHTYSEKAATTKSEK